MSHFTVVIATDDPGKIEDLLAPYDESMAVDPYRNYEGGAARDYWAVKHLREEGRITVPDEDLTWRHVAEAYNAKYGEEEGEHLFIDEDGVRAFTMSTYNPESKWDWYSIGGRWLGYFPIKPGGGLIPADEIINGTPGAFDNEAEDGCCDGGKKRHLDLDALRAKKAQAAREEHQAYHRVVEGTRPATPWSVFIARVEDKEGAFADYSIDHAREDYHSQPRVRALAQSEEFKHHWGLEPEEYEVPEDDYAQRAADRAVPGYAVLTQEGQWMAPGKMGWWGMGSDDEESYDAYVKAANAYIDGLDDDTYLIVVDCHI